MPIPVVRHQPSFLGIRGLAWAAVVVILGLVATCSGKAPTTTGGPRPVPFFAVPTLTAPPTPSPTLSPWPKPSPSLTPWPKPSPSATPISTVDSFKRVVTSSDFQAQGSISGSVAVALVIGSTSGAITGTFMVKGADSAVSIAWGILGITTSSDNIVVGDSAYSRTNGGQWSKAPASGKTLQGFVGSGIVLTDEGVESKFGKQLHRLSVADIASVDLAAFGITAGPGQENLKVSSVSFWAEDDGTPAGLSIQASLDQQIIGTPSHETVTVDINIDRLSGVTITAPTS
ncbi:MAG TPA: hypothetical protein VIK06_04695 [Candidatus Limnocylindrales bacterium]